MATLFSIKQTYSPFSVSSPFAVVAAAWLQHSLAAVHRSVICHPWCCDLSPLWWAADGRRSFCVVRLICLDVVFAFLRDPFAVPFGAWVQTDMVRHWILSGLRDGRPVCALCARRQILFSVPHSFSFSHVTWPYICHAYLTFP